MAARVTATGVVAASPRAHAGSDAPKRRAQDAFERELIAHLPYLRNFSRRLCGGRECAEDIAQETLVKAWRARDRFEPGTNLKAWLFTILRNEYHSQKRRSWRQTCWDEGLGEDIPAPANEQLWAMDLSDCARALEQLPIRQRETLLLVGVGGFTYETAADLLDAPVGTLKSRLARARSGLATLLASAQSLQPRPEARAANGVDDILAQMTAVEAAAHPAEPRSPQSR
jgi:RNA polymerase sigma-70 factor (ECF subfamily)